MQFLLQHTGAPSTNNGSAFALTSCTLYHIPFDMLMKIIHECPVPYTLYPIPFKPYIIPCTLYPIPYTLCPMPYTPCPAPNTLYP